MNERATRRPPTAVLALTTAVGLLTSRPPEGEDRGVWLEKRFDFPCNGRHFDRLPYRLTSKQIVVTGRDYLRPSVTLWPDYL